MTAQFICCRTMCAYDSLRKRRGCTRISCSSTKASRTAYSSVDVLQTCRGTVTQFLTTCSGWSSLLKTKEWSAMEVTKDTTVEAEFDAIDRWIERILEELQTGMLSGVEAK